MEAEISIISVEPSVAKEAFDENISMLVKDFLYTECIVDDKAATRIMSQLKSIYAVGASGFSASFYMKKENEKEPTEKEAEEQKEFINDLCEQLNDVLSKVQINLILSTAKLLAEQDAMLQKRVLN